MTYKYPMRTWICQVALTTLFFSLPPVVAQGADDLFSLSLHELSQVKVSIANRTAEHFTDAPSSVTVITRREIDQLGVRTLTELLNYVPGFQNYMSPQDSNRSLILARGLADVYGHHLLLMIDGHRINDEYTGGFTFANHLLSLYNVKQVEFIRGPGSALYGSNAFSGAINIITEKRGQAELTVGSNDTKGIAAASFGQAGTLDASAAFNYYRDDGASYRKLTDKNGVNKTSQDPVEIFEARADLNYGRSRLITEHISSRLSDYYVFRRINNGINKNNSQRFGLYLEHDFALPQNWQGSGRIGYMRHKRQQQTLLLPTDTTPFKDDWQQDTREAQLDFSYLSSEGHQLSSGIYVGKMDIPTATSNFDPRYVLDKSRRTVGIYLQDQVNLRQDLRLTAGLRYDSYSDFGDSINPRLALLYRWREHHSLKFMYGRAYRAPSLGDLYDKEDLIGSGNLFLKPETVNSYELAYQHSKDNNNLIITWFYNDYRDFISTRTVTTGFKIDNAYDNRTQGLELDLRWKLGKHWDTRAGLTHILTSDTDLAAGVNITNPADLTPQTYGNAQINFQHNRWNWNLSTVAHDGIDVLQDSGVTTVFNTKIIYRTGRYWNVSLNVKNLFNKNYGTPQSRILGQDSLGNNIQELPSRGREIFLTLQLNKNT